MATQRSEHQPSRLSFLLCILWSSLVPNLASSTLSVRCLHGCYSGWVQTETRPSNIARMHMLTIVSMGVPEVGSHMLQTRSLCFPACVCLAFCMVGRMFAACSFQPFCICGKILSDASTTLHQQLLIGRFGCIPQTRHHVCGDVGRG